jgi:hypothetical protein
MTARAQCQCGLWMPWDVFKKHIEMMHEEIDDKKEERQCPLAVAHVPARGPATPARMGRVA